MIVVVIMSAAAIAIVSLMLLVAEVRDEVRDAREPRTPSLEERVARLEAQMSTGRVDRRVVSEDFEPVTYREVVTKYPLPGSVARKVPEPGRGKVSRS